MDPDYPPLEEPATPEYVLAVLRDAHRFGNFYCGPPDPAAVLTFETTVDDWDHACGLLPWPELGRAENRIWGIDVPDDEWLGVLEPSGEKRLSGVCRLIAARATRPVCRPLGIAGRDCRAAGTFLTVRTLLRRAGADIAGVGPSTPLGPYARRHPGVFLGPVALLAPGALPVPRVRVSRAFDAGLLGLLAAAAGAFAALSAGRYGIAAAGAAAAMTCCGLAWYAASRIRPASVEFGDLRTFRDLAAALAGDGGDGGAEPAAAADRPAR